MISLLLAQMTEPWGYGQSIIRRLLNKEKSIWMRKLMKWDQIFGFFIWFYNIRTGDIPDEGKGRCVAISPDGEYLVVGFKEGTIKIYDKELN